MQDENAVIVTDERKPLSRRARRTERPTRKRKQRSENVGGHSFNTRQMKRITTASELCTALFAHLDASNPRIPVDPTIAAAKRYLLQDLKRGSIIDTPPAYFGEILPRIHWSNPPPDAERCGLDLLLFMGELSQAMHQHQRYNLPVAEIPEILLAYLKDRDLQFEKSGKQWWVRSTPEYERKHATVVRVPLPRAPRENPLDLDD